MDSLNAFMNAVEFGLEIPVFPNWKTRWHMEDKISQTYLMEAMGIPMPDTRILWSRDEAIDYLSSAE